jgi:hypothetical protein
MGGAVKAVGKAVGIQKSPVQIAAQTLAKEKPVERASQGDEAMAARRRGARNRGRMLMSEARLGAQDETLGGGQSLG